MFTYKYSKKYLLIYLYSKFFSTSALITIADTAYIFNC